MSYLAAVDQLNAMVPELYTGSGQPRRKFSLGEFRILLGALGNPHMKSRSVLIAGTNGKGSTAATLASILVASGLRTGLYTSPHLTRPNERICLNGEEIGDDTFAELYFRVRAAAEELICDGRLPQLPSYFEILTAQAFIYFAETKAEIAVLEVGMGGRLDATNVVNPLISVITDISLDHTEWLGPTLGAITREKAGILRADGVLVTLPQEPEVDQVLRGMVRELGVRLIDASLYLPAEKPEELGVYAVPGLGRLVEVSSPLPGPHQQRNVALAVASAIEIGLSCTLPVTAASIENGIRQTHWPGRLERLEKHGVAWTLDVAHNPAGALALRAGLKGMFGHKRFQTLIFSCLRDKPVMELGEILFPLFEKVIVAPLSSVRAASMDDLVAAATAAGTSAIVAASVEDAMKLAIQGVQDTGEVRGSIVVSGSVYLVGEVRRRLMNETGVQA
jgi:dihydrofolate synthase/folylpolyglutamate synthase